MDSNEFRHWGYQCIEWAANYMETLESRDPLPHCAPGYLAEIVPKDPPEEPEPFSAILKDIEPCIMQGMSHWQHPKFYAYFPSGNSWPSILGDLLSNGLAIDGSAWEFCPAATELEIIVMDWCAKFLGLPEFFLSKYSVPGSKGGGAIQTCASEAIMLSLLVAREEAVRKLQKVYPEKLRGELLSKLTAYCSNQCHSCVEKNANVLAVTLRQLESDDRGKIPGLVLSAAIKEDMANGNFPFFYCAIMGSTGICAFDDLEELGPICEQYHMWMHVDGAYAGSCLSCPENRYLSIGMEYAQSFNTNTNKWMLTNFDGSLHWFKNKNKLTDIFSGYDASIHKDLVTDFRNWGIPSTRRFRALKIWMVIRSYGVKGLRSYIRRHILLSKVFENYVRQDPRFEVVNVVRVGLCCFRLKGPNDLNSRYLDDMNASRKIHMVPSNFKGQYLIRFAPCYEHLTVEHIKEAWKTCSEFATVVIRLYEEGITDTTAVDELLKQQARVIRGQPESSLARISSVKAEVRELERRRSTAPEYIINQFHPHEHKPNFRPSIDGDDEDLETIRARVRTRKPTNELALDPSSATNSSISGQRDVDRTNGQALKGGAEKSTSKIGKSSHHHHEDRRDRSTSRPNHNKKR